MIGYFNYTVWLTYLSLLSAVSGIIISLYGMGHPYLGMYCLMFSGLCDAFDGRVARTKKDRTEAECKFGIQIDSLSDLVAFGILPVCIGIAMIISGPGLEGIPHIAFKKLHWVTVALVILVMLFYALTAMIRLAYFNVVEEERQKSEGGCRKTYIGLPVTASALVFPTILLIQYVTPIDVTPLYFLFMLLTAILFISKINVKKPGLKGILIMVGFGLVEAILIALRYPRG